MNDTTDKAAPQYALAHRTVPDLWMSADALRAVRQDSPDAASAYERLQAIEAELARRGMPPEGMKLARALLVAQTAGKITGRPLTLTIARAVLCGAAQQAEQYPERLSSQRAYHGAMLVVRHLEQAAVADALAEVTR